VRKRIPVEHIKVRAFFLSNQETAPRLDASLFSSCIFAHNNRFPKPSRHMIKERSRAAS